MMGKFFRKLSEEERSTCGQIFSHYKSGMYHYAYAFVGNECDAEDVVQIVMERIVRLYDRIDFGEVGSSSCNALVFTMTKYAALDFLKHRKLTPKLVRKLEQMWMEEKDPDIQQVCVDMEQYDQLVQIIDGMKGIQKDVLRLRAMCDLSAKEAGEILGVSDKVVNQRYWRAKKSLARILKERERDG